MSSPQCSLPGLFSKELLIFDNKCFPTFALISFIWCKFKITPRPLHHSPPPLIKVKGLIKKLISTEGALRPATTNDYHPSFQSHPIHPHICSCGDDLSYQGRPMTTNDFKWLPMTTNDYHWLPMTTFWLHSDYILTTFWLHSDYILTSCWAYLWHILGKFWAFLGHILGIYCAYICHLLVIYWSYIGHISGISWAYFGHILGISEAYPRHIHGISKAYFWHILGIS